MRFANGRTILGFVAGTGSSTKPFTLGQQIPLMFRDGASPRAKLVERDDALVRAHNQLIGTAALCCFIASFFAPGTTAVTCLVSIAGIWWFRDRVAVASGDAVFVVTDERVQGSVARPSPRRLPPPSVTCGERAANAPAQLASSRPISDLRVRMRVTD